MPGTGRAMTAGLLLVVAALLVLTTTTATGPVVELRPRPPEPTAGLTPSGGGTPTATPTGPTSAGPAPRASRPPVWTLPDLRWLDALVSWLFLLALGAVAGVLAWRWPRSRVVRRRLAVGQVATQPDAGLEERLAAELAAAADHVERGGDPRRVVVECWARLEGAAAAAGTARARSETPEELVGRVLAEQSVDAAALARLTALYREARFSSHPVDEGMRADALAALAAVRRGLERAGSA